MYGRAMSCDVCGSIKMTTLDDDVYLVDGAVHGWIRVHVNQPLVDNYTYHGPTQSYAIGSVDCCTILCAQNYLRECSQKSAPVDADDK